jgi:hypothetical protein
LTNILESLTNLCQDTLRSICSTHLHAKDESTNCCAANTSFVHQVSFQIAIQEVLFCLDLLVPARVVIPEALRGDGVRRLSKSAVLGRSPDVAVHHLDVVQGIVAQCLPNVAGCTEPKLGKETIIKRVEKHLGTWLVIEVVEK